MNPAPRSSLKSRTLITVLVVALAAAACGQRQVPISQLPIETLLERGMAAYDAEDWDDAVRYLERFTLVAPAHARLGEARYKLGMAEFRRKKYVTSAAEFDRLARDLPRHELADDARFMVCRSYEELSPIPERDQEYTRAAIDHCRSLLDYHPDSEYAERARAIIERMRTKLATKLYETGEWYFRRRAFDSAIIYLEDVLERYPDTRVAPAALLKLHETYVRLGYEEEAQETRERLLSEYPESEAARLLRDGAAGP